MKFSKNRQTAMDFFNELTTKNQYKTQPTNNDPHLKSVQKNIIMFQQALSTSTYQQLIEAFNIFYESLKKTQISQATI